MDVIGLGALCLGGLCVHYEVEDDTFYARGLKASWFVNGWRVEDVPTADEFDRLTKSLASMLLDGHYSTEPLSNGGGNVERAGGAGAPPGSGPSRQSKSGRKTRKNTNRNDEGYLKW